MGEGCGEGFCLRYADALSSWWLERKDECWVVPGAFAACSGVTSWSIWIVSFLVTCGSRVVLVKDLQILGAEPFLGRRHGELCLQQARLPMQMLQKDKYKSSGFLCNTKLMDRSFWNRKILTNKQTKKTPPPPTNQPPPTKQLPIQHPKIAGVRLFLCDTSYFQPCSLPNIRKTYCTLVSYKSLQSGTWSHCISQVASVPRKDLAVFYDAKHLWDGSWCMVKPVSCKVLVNCFPPFWGQILGNCRVCWGSIPYLSGSFFLVFQKYCVTRATLWMCMPPICPPLRLGGWGWSCELSVAC